MKLYHGTSEAALRSALEVGLKPRGGKGTDNWTRTIGSNPRCVYLTELYAGFFADNATKGDDRWGILEVDTDKLDQRRLVPDEDALEQAFRDKSPDDFEFGTPSHQIVTHLAGLDMKRRTAWFRARLLQFSNLWPTSVRSMGTCGYRGEVPPRALTRAVLYDPGSNPAMTLMCLDPTISIANASICRPKYRALTAWLVGHPLDVEPWRGILDVDEVRRVAETRSIEVLK